MYIELVQANDPLYPDVCRVALEVYDEVLEVAPASFPARFLALIDNTDVVGSVGIYPGETVSELLTESYCRKHHVPPDAYLPLSGRRSIFEAGCFNLKKEYRKYAPTLFTAVYEYAAAIGAQHILLTAANTLTRIFHLIGTERVILCHPQATDFTCAPELYDKWRETYFERRKPVSCFLRVAQALMAYQAKVRTNRDLLPVVDVGPKLQHILEVRQVAVTP